MIVPSSSAVAVSTPLRVAKRTVPVAVPGGVQDVCGGQRGVPAHVDLGGRGEPAQRPVGVAARGQRVREGGLGEVDLGGDLLEPGVVGEGAGVEEQDSRGVAGEGAVGEGVDDSNPHGRERRGATRPRTKANPGELDTEWGPVWGLVVATGGAGRADAAFPVTCAGDGCTVPRTAARLHGGDAVVRRETR